MSRTLTGGKTYRPESGQDVPRSRSWLAIKGLRQGWPTSPKKGASLAHELRQHLREPERHTRRRCVPAFRHYLPMIHILRHCSLDFDLSGVYDDFDDDNNLMAHFDAREVLST
jgi:hypothetical protein